MSDRARLPLRFDPARLQAEAAALPASAWVPHFVPQNYRGDWAALPLRAPAGEAHPIRMIYPDPGCGEFVDTEFLRASPYLTEVLSRFHCPLGVVRLMRLGPGSEIFEHRDHDLGLEGGAVRLHVPVQTSAAVDFRLGGERVDMAPGECWYLRLSDPHAVTNAGAAPRLHLVIDATVNPWLEELVRQAAGGARGAPRFQDPLVQRLVDFLLAIGLEVEAWDGGTPTFVPGIRVEAGRLLVHETDLDYPGDLLHEAGHLAILTRAERVAVTHDTGGEQHQEMCADAWAVAAATHLGVPLELVFHDAGYQGSSEALRAAYRDGTGPGVPMLACWGMTSASNGWSDPAVPRFPGMARWLRE